MVISKDKKRDLFLYHGDLKDFNIPFRKIKDFSWDSDTSKHSIEAWIDCHLSIPENKLGSYDLYVALEGNKYFVAFKNNKKGCYVYSPIDLKHEGKNFSLMYAIRDLKITSTQLNSTNEYQISTKNYA